MPCGTERLCWCLHQLLFLASVHCSKKGIKSGSHRSDTPGALEIWINRRRCAGAIKRSTSFPICLYTIDHVRECTLKIARDGSAFCGQTRSLSLAAICDLNSVPHGQLFIHRLLCSPLSSLPAHHLASRQTPATWHFSVLQPSTN